MFKKISNKPNSRSVIISILTFILLLTYRNIFVNNNKSMAKELSPPEKIPLISLQILKKLEPEAKTYPNRTLKNPFLQKHLKLNNRYEKNPTATTTTQLHLQGTLITSQDNLAIISVDKTVATYHKNDIVAGYVVQEIKSDSVILLNQTSQNIEFLNLKD